MASLSVPIPVDAHTPRRADVGGIIQMSALHAENCMTDARTSHTAKPFAEPGSATIEDFGRIDMRVARVVAADPFPQARKPAYRLTLDFGPGGIKRSSAQLPSTYPDPESLVGRLVIAVVNFAPRNVAGFQSEVLVLGALPADGQIPLLSVDEGASPGDPIG